jgi:CHRD domain
VRECTRLLVCLFALMALAAAAAGEEFSARLGRVPVDSRNQASIAGLGHATAELDGNRLQITGDFAGLLGPATIANLHIGPAVGVRGEAFHELEVTPATAGKLSGSLSLNDEQLTALRAGHIYIQIHSESAPDGNLWGWLLDD